ncbi:MAG: VWA domain-containing protein [Pseudomonadota bacterium]
MVKKSVPMERGEKAVAEEKSSSSDIARFLKAAEQTASTPGGRLVFALDATMSRQPTWDRACQIQASMFQVAGAASGLAVQLVYFRGFGECRASKWVTNPASLAQMMTRIDCRGGTTQISKVFMHANKESSKHRIAALVYIGDAMEEPVDRICDLAGKLGLKGVKAFMFQEGMDRDAEHAFREVARLTNGAYMRLSSSSAKELEELLKAVAAFATGGKTALENHRGKSAQALLEQLKR